MHRKYDVRFCLPCTLYSVYDPFRYLFPIRFYCPHSRLLYSKKPVCKLSRKSFFCHILITMLMIVPPVYYFLHLSDVCKQQNSMCFLSISDRIFLSGTVFMAIIDLKKIKPHLYEFDSWLYIFRKRKSFSLTKVIQVSYLRRFKLLRLFSFVIILINLFISTFSYFSLLNKLPVNISLQILRSYYYILQQRNITEIMRKISLFGTTLQSFEESLKTCVTSNTNLELTFRRYQSLVRRINGTISLFLEQMAIVLFVWTLMAVIFLVLNFYILIKYEDYDVYVMSVIHIRLFNTIFAIVIILILTEQDINKKVRLDDN